MNRFMETHPSVMTVYHPIAGLRCNNVDGKGSLEFQIFQVDLFSRGNLYNFCGCPSQAVLMIQV